MKAQTHCWWVLQLLWAVQRLFRTELDPGRTELDPCQRPRQSLFRMELDLGRACLGWSWT